MKKKVLAIAMTTMMVAGVFAGSSTKETPAPDTAKEEETAKEEGTPKEETPAIDVAIGVCIYKFNDTFMTGVRNNMSSRADELGVSLDIVDSQNKQPTQNEQVDTFITKGMNALAINAVDRTAAGPLVDKAKAENLPVVFLNREPEESVMQSYDKVWYVGAKAEQSGTMSGEIVADYWKAHPEADKNDDKKLQYIMEEILKISDEVTIMRDGQYVGTWPSSELTTDLIINRMVGRDLTNRFPPKNYQTSKAVILEVKNLTATNKKSFKDISFQLFKGEILGIGGLVGAQRTELVEAIFGLRGIESGTIIKNGEIYKVKSVDDAKKHKIALLIEERRATGIFGVLSITDNTVVASQKSFARVGVLNNQKRKEASIDYNLFVKHKNTHNGNPHSKPFWWKSTKNTDCQMVFDRP